MQLSLFGQRFHRDYDIMDYLKKFSESRLELFFFYNGILNLAQNSPQKIYFELNKNILNL